MSRVAKKPVGLPKGVTATVSEGSVTVKGAKGSLSLPLSRGITVAQDEQELVVKVTDGLVERPISIDGDGTDWDGIEQNLVSGPEHLWFGQGMRPEKWHGDQDLSFRWRGAWHGNKLCFLIEVTDDHVAAAPLLAMSEECQRWVKELIVFIS